MTEELCRIGVVAVIRDGEGRLLMEKRNIEEEDGKQWGLIAGGKKAGENSLEAAEREVMEETGTEFEPEKIAGIVEHDDHRGDITSWTVVVIEGKIDGEPENMEPGKREEVAWKPEDKLPDNLHPTTKMALEITEKEETHPEI